jgi:phosphoglycolate phosphatase-like HAD superfamily hydrolase
MIQFCTLLRLNGAAMLGLTMVAVAAPAPPHIDVQKVSTTVANVVVPRPDEVFGALNKLGGVNWKQYVRTDRSSNFTERPRIALLLGSVIADGFIAVQAEDTPAVKEIGQRVQSLAERINVKSSITQHAKAIIEGADKKRWDNVRRELDRTQNEVQRAMDELHDQKLSQLVSLGGWLRGTEVLTAVVTKNFKSEGAELLHQPDLLVHFETQLQDMPEFKSQTPLIDQIRGALTEVKPLISTSQKISPEAVRKINEITTRLDLAIVTKQ